MVEEALKEHEFLKNLPEGLVKTLAPMARLRSFRAGARLLRHDAEIREFLLLRQGRVALELDSPQSDAHLLQTLNPGDVLGWSWLVPPYKSHFDASALEDGEAVAIDCHALREAMEQDHDLGYAVLKRFIPTILGRLQACRLQVMDVYARPAGA